MTEIDLALSRETPTLGALLADAREHYGNEADHDLLTTAVLGALLVRSDAFNVLYPVISSWVNGQERARIRMAERLEMAARRERGAAPNAAQDAMRAFLRGRCYVPGQGLVPWGEMTPVFHRLRIDYLKQRLRAYTEGTQRTIERHEAAIGLLAQHKCETLSEYVGRFGELPDGFAASPATDPA